MAHMIDMTGGRANMAFLGDRKDIWHKLGQSMQAGMDMQAWAKAAGLDWQAIMVQAYCDLGGLPLDVQGGNRFRAVDDRRHVVRSDNGQPLGYVSDGYKPVQPIEVLEWFQRYIDVDSRFQLDVAGSLKKGEIIWATATYNGEMNVAGDKHTARLLMTTTFDGSGATINKGTMVRTVCNNTLSAALADGKCEVRTRHNTRFDAARVGRELGRIADGFGAYKRMGEAMAAVEMNKDAVAKFFKTMLDIPFETDWKSLSSKKQNQFDALRQSYATTGRETRPGTAWCALNAVTRYVDHERSTRGGDSELEARVLSTQFGSGAAMKAHAVEYLTSGGKLLEAVLSTTPAMHIGDSLLDAAISNTKLN